MTTINLTEDFEKWASQFVDMQSNDGGEEKVQISLTQEQCEQLIEALNGLFCLISHCPAGEDAIRLARLINKAQMTLGHPSLKSEFEVIKGKSDDS